MTSESVTAFLQIVSRADAKAHGIRKYFTAIRCRRGHASERSTATGHCLACERERSARREQSAEYREKRSAAAKKRRAQPGYIEAEKERYLSQAVQERVRAYRRSEPVKRKRRAYAKSAKGRAALSERSKRFRSTPYGAAKSAARDMVSRALARAGKEKSDRTHEILGYSPNDLARHIESLFAPGMTWENRRKWHIDHIRPLSSFDLSTIEGVRNANSLHNLRPIWAKKNLKKSDSWDGNLTLPL